MKHIATCAAAFAAFVLLFALLPAFGSVRAYAFSVEPMSAEATSQSEEEFAPEEEAAPEEDGALGGLVDGFLAKLKAKYGEGYEAYLDVILSEWGSVEDYLLSLAGERDDPASNGWRAFIGGLSETAPVWAPALSVLLLIAVYLYKRYTERRTAKEFRSYKTTMFRELNKMQESLYALGKSELKQLGTGSVTEPERAALEEAMKGLKEEEDGGSGV